MLNLKNIEIKKNYDSDKDDLLKDFFIPVLSTAVLYRRLAGFFSSGIFSAASRGIKELIDNNGKMQLIIGVQVNEEDYLMLKKIVKESKELPEKYITNKIDNLEEFLKSEHVEAMGWMILNNLLDIKFAVTNRGGIFHMKVGIVTDKNGDSLSFSGSDNETPSGWRHNVEEFKVFRKWIDSEADYFNADEEKFNRFWNDKGNNVFIFSLPKAFRERIINSVPKNKDYLKIFNENEYNNVNINDKYNFNIVNEKKRNIELRDIQIAARDAWINNCFKGILEMATGTGKTIASFGCLNELLKKEKKLAIVISAPYSHLVSQWYKEFMNIAERGKEIYFSELFNITKNKTVVTQVNKWLNKTSNLIADFNNNILDKILIFTTHETFYGDKFIKQINNIKHPICLIADEVHGLGSTERKKGFIQRYNYKLGLSATPNRWFDEEGTKLIFEFFGKSVYKFSLLDAITKINPLTGETYLTPYKYYPNFTELNEAEVEKYNEFTKKISKISSYKDKDLKYQRNYELLTNQRADILKNAENKLFILKNILNKFNSSEIKNMFIYCNEGGQIEEVAKILEEMKIKFKRFTGNEDSKPKKKYGNLSERDWILNKFAIGHYQCLLAMKCLDEGVDVPSAEIGIIIASSTNPREFIQRRGRLLRRNPGKRRAYIYDFIIMPPNPVKYNLDKEVELYEHSIYRKEMLRYKEFVETAENSAECLLELIKSEKKYYKL